MNTLERLGTATAVGLVLATDLAGCGGKSGVELCDSPRAESSLYPGDQNIAGVDDHDQGTWENGVAIQLPPNGAEPKGTEYVTIGYNVPDHGQVHHDSQLMPLWEARSTVMKIGEHPVKFSVVLSGPVGSEVCTTTPKPYFGPKIAIGKLTSQHLVSPVFN